MKGIFYIFNCKGITTTEENLSSFILVFIHIIYKGITTL